MAYRFSGSSLRGLPTDLHGRGRVQEEFLVRPGLSAVVDGLVRRGGQVTACRLVRQQNCWQGTAAFDRSDTVRGIELFPERRFEIRIGEQRISELAVAGDKSVVHRGVLKGFVGVRVALSREVRHADERVPVAAGICVHRSSPCSGPGRVAGSSPSSMLHTPMPQ